MAKKTVATKKTTAVATTKKSTALAKGSAGIPAHLKGVKMVGATASTDVSDNLIPMVSILQKNSPQVEKRGASYVPGAEPGDFFVKNDSNPIIKGEDGFLFQPCYFDKGTVVWLPRNKGGGGGGGFIAYHQNKMPSDIPGSKQAPHPEDPNKKIWVDGDGNLLVETRYFGGFIIDEETLIPSPAVVPFASSGHTVAKTWNMLMNKKLIDGEKADMCAVYYRFKTRLKEKGPNTWYIAEITDAGEVEDGLATTYWVPSVEDLERGQALAKAMNSGEKRFDRAAAGNGDEVADDGSM